MFLQLIAVHVNVPAIMIEHAACFIIFSIRFLISLLLCPFYFFRFLEYANTEKMSRTERGTVNGGQRPVFVKSCTLFIAKAKAIKKRVSVPRSLVHQFTCPSPPSND